jgi:hypothetical protein
MVSLGTVARVDWWIVAMNGCKSTVADSTSSIFLSLLIVPILTDNFVFTTFSLLLIFFNFSNNDGHFEYNVNKLHEGKKKMRNLLLPLVLFGTSFVFFFSNGV